MATSSSSATAKSPAAELFARQTDKAAKISVPDSLRGLRMPVAQQAQPGRDRIAGGHAEQASVGLGQEDEVSHDYSDTFSRPLAPQGKIPISASPPPIERNRPGDSFLSFFDGLLVKTGID